MTTLVEQTLRQLRADLEEITQAYQQEPREDLLSAIFQLQVRIQELESSL